MRVGGYVAVLLVLGAGCLQSSEPSAFSAAPSASSSITGGSPGPAGEGEPLAANRTLAEPPRWTVGEWWRVRLTDAFGGGSYEARRVVAAEQGDDYLVGMPKEEWSDPLLLLHLPGFGEVSRQDFSFDVHDVRFAPVQFPLEAGKTWTTAFEGRAVTAEVKSVDGSKAHIYLAGAQDHANLTYDAETGEIVRYVADGYASYEVLEHGFGFQGIVLVPHMQDVVFQLFRFAAVLGGSPGAPPLETLTVASKYDRVSFVTILGTVLPSPESPQAAYEERVTAPQDRVFEDRLTPADAPGLHVRFYSLDRPGGEWSFLHLALGPGIAGAEGIGYHQWQVDLPSGEIKTSGGA